MKKQQEQLHGGGSASRGKPAGTSTVVAQIFYYKCITKKFDLENDGESDRAQHLQWCSSMVNISTAIKDVTNLCH